MKFLLHLSFVAQHDLSVDSLYSWMKIDENYASIPVE